MISTGPMISIGCAGRMRHFVLVMVKDAATFMSTLWLSARGVPLAEFVRMATSGPFCVRVR